MKRTVFIIFLLNIFWSGMAQDISITFSAADEHAPVEKVQATNLSTGQSVTLPGNQTLILTRGSAIANIEEPEVNGLIFPNPFSGSTILAIPVFEESPVILILRNLDGKVLASLEQDLFPGTHLFSLKMAKSGLYTVNITTKAGVAGHKLLNISDCDAGFGISYQRSVSARFLPRLAKSGQEGFILGYTPGDVIHFACTSHANTTIIADQPVISRNYEVHFIACQDPDGKDYPIVRIGSQWWMAENLAYLPEVYPPGSGSGSERRYYVYPYQGSDITLAKTVAFIQHTEFYTIGRQRLMAFLPAQIIKVLSKALVLMAGICRVMRNGPNWKKSWAWIQRMQRRPVHAIQEKPGYS